MVKGFFEEFGYTVVKALLALRFKYEKYLYYLKNISIREWELVSGIIMWLVAKDAAQLVSGIWGWDMYTE